jgi:hypothetical protein
VPGMPRETQWAGGLTGFSVDSWRVPLLSPTLQLRDGGGEDREEIAHPSTQPGEAVSA